jgi:hypothetical protein
MRPNKLTTLSGTKDPLLLKFRSSMIAWGPLRAPKSGLSHRLRDLRHSLVATTGMLSHFYSFSYLPLSLSVFASNGSIAISFVDILNL